MRVLGNHSVGGTHNRIASGEKASGLGYITIAGTAGEKGVVETAGLMSMGRVALGAFVQSDVPVTLRFTLNRDAKDPHTVWGNQMVIPAGDIKPIPFPFLGIEVTFTGAGGILTIGAL